VVDALDEIAEETGKTVPQISLNWLLSRPPSPISWSARGPRSS
jgi:aryl-alcohol dehydrogenase-like predicted oxidoreductase